MTARRTLTDDERSLLTNALESATAKWRECVATSRDAKQPRLARQFERQIEQAGALADLLELADIITLEGV